MPDHKPFVLASRYNVVEPLQSGGMATVYRARDLATDQSVAVKRFDRDRNVPEIIAEAYAREVEALKCLTHPSIVRILDSGEDDQGNPYLVLELMEHDLLTEKANNGPAFEGWDNFSELIALPLLEALIYAHEQGVAHRDVKPANILLASTGSPKLADFGVSKLKRNLKPRITLQGFSSPPFSAPEADKGDSTYSRDVFSLAAVCVWALTDSPITDYSELCKQVSVLDTPKEVRDCLCGALHADPTRRFGNAILFANELRAIARKRSKAREQRSRVACSLVVLPSAVTKAQLAFQGVANPREAMRRDLAGETHIQRYIDRVSQEAVLDQYRVIGAEKIYHIAKDNRSNDGFVLLSVFSQAAQTLQFLRESSPECPLDFRIGVTAGTRGWAEIVHAIEAAFANHDLRQQEEAAAAEVDVFALWGRVLEAQLQFEKAKVPVLSLRDATSRGRHLVVPAKGQDLSCVEVLQRWRIDNGQERFIPAVVLEVLADEVVFDVEGNARAVPSDGRLLFDIHAQRVAIDRQRSALDRLRSGVTAFPALRDLIAEPSIAKSPEDRVPAGILSRADMEPVAQRIVAHALGSRDVVLVEGPPGTGKTSFIVELILQELHTNPRARVLVSSQTNIAIDNALERLADKRGSHKLLRVANELATSVSESAKPYLLDKQLKQWRDEILVDAAKGLDAWASSRNINPGDARVGSLIRRLQKTLLKLADQKKKRAGSVEDLRALEGQKSRAEALGNRADEAMAKQAIDECKSTIRIIDQEIRSLEAEQKQLRQNIAELRADAAALTELPAHELDEWADVFFGEHGVEHDAEAILDIQAEWLSRFSTYEGLVRPLAERSSVIFATCIGLAQSLGNSREVIDCDFDLCIIDEASKATATECLVPMVAARRTVVVGDSRQLSPFDGGLFRDEELCERYGVHGLEARESLFERFRRLLPSGNIFQLETQYRMVEPIGSLVSECFYEGKLKSKRQSVYKPLLSLTGKAVNWFTTEFNEDRQEQKHGTTFLNTCEVGIIERLLLRLDAACAPQRQQRRCSVMVLSGYGGQVGLCEHRLSHLSRRLTSLDVQVCTIDRVQGREADVVMYSVTRSNAAGDLGFLKKDSRINVALSRARDLLCIVGDAPFVDRAREEAGLKRVLGYIRDHAATCCIDAPPS
jgi:hypothetical protein